MKWGHWIGHLVIAVSFALMLISVVAFKLMHRRSRRRSPMQDRRVGHLPGQQLLVRIQHHDTEVLTSISTMFTALPLMFMIWMTFRLPWSNVRIGVVDWFFVVGAAAMFAWGLRDYIRNYRSRENARDGWIAEQVTGMQLNRLVAQSCTVLHDLPADGFNIDHIVVAPRAVYAVETKSFRKPLKVPKGDNYRVAFDGKTLRFPDMSNADAIAQAERYASWLARTLRDAGFDVPVVPALALPGWRVEQSEEAWRASKVKVFSPMGGGSNFMGKPIENIAGDKRKAIAEALALRFPVISD
ncbi:nuclease-related domain-containing protein [Luteimonas sp. A482]